ncbi:hypothetical protein FB451DRAFT_1404942 [Mycena latifolia]|nr:hypothetical protein FB451DRAFT_1404942 [Mycena latifolia]
MLRSSHYSYLGVDLADFSQDLLTAILRLFPALTALRAETNTISTGWLLDTLTPPAHLLLHELNIVDGNVLHSELWIAFLWAHLDRGTRLRRFELSSVGPVPHILPDLKPFFERGLEVLLKYVQRR